METETLTSCLLCGSDRIGPLYPEKDISSCNECGYAFANPRPTLPELVRYYSRPAQYDSWISEEKARTRMWRRRLERIIPIRKPGSLLDVGAGIGQFLHIAKPAFSEVFGTEVSSSAVSIAKDRCGLNILQAEIEAADFGQRTFDNITLFDVLEHVPDPVGTIERCRSLLSPGGVLVIAVPNDLRCLTGKVQTMAGRIGIRAFEDPGVQVLPRIALDGSISEIHLSHFTPEVLRRLLERSGFSITDLSLDPFYVASGPTLLLHHLYYRAMSVLWAVTGRNYYSTVFVSAVKKPEDAVDPAGRGINRPNHPSKPPGDAFHRNQPPASGAPVCQSR